MAPVIFKKVQKAMSPNSNRDEDENFSLTDTYFNGIGFKSVESGSANDDPLLFIDANEDYVNQSNEEEASEDPSLHLGRNYNYTTNNSNNNNVEDEGRLGAARQPGQPDDKKNNYGNGLSKLKAYSAPFHSYLAQFLSDNQSQPAANAGDTIPKPKASPSSNAYEFTFHNKYVEEDDVSTLGGGSIVKGDNTFGSSTPDMFVGQALAPPSADLPDPAQLHHVRTQSTEKSHMSVDLYYDYTDPSSSRDEDGDPSNKNKAPQDHIPRQQQQTEKLTIISPINDSEDNHRTNRSAVTTQSEEEEEERRRRKWRIFCFLIVVAIFLLLVSAAVLTIGLLQLQEGDSNSETDSSNNENNNNNDVPTPSPFFDLVPTMEGQEGTTTPEVEQARQIMMQIISKLSPSSFMNLVNATSPQTRALEWLARDPLFQTYELDQLVQRWVLATFYYSTNGDAWDYASTDPVTTRAATNNNTDTTASTPWLSYTDECTWHSSDMEKDTCDKDGNIIALHLKNFGLGGDLPNEIQMLSSTLEQLVLPSNTIGGTIPVVYANLRQLKRLQLTDNNFRGDIPSQLGQLSNLVVMGLGRNKLTGTLPQEFGQLESLKTFGIEGNGISGTLPAVFSNLNHLEYFSMENNKLTGTVPSEFGKLSSLVSLMVHKNELTGSMPLELCPRRNDNSIIKLVADCSEVECECCTSCCVGCKGDDGKVVAPTVSPAPTSSPVAPNVTDPLLADVNDSEWGNSDNVTAMVPSGMASLMPSDTPSLMPSGAPSQCKTKVSADKACYNRTGDLLKLSFTICDPKEDDWLGFFSVKTLNEMNANKAISSDDAALWTKVCGTQFCHDAVGGGSIILSNDRHWEMLVQNMYRILLIRGNNDREFARSPSFRVGKCE